MSSATVGTSSDEPTFEQQTLPMEETDSAPTPVEVPLPVASAGESIPDPELQDEFADEPLSPYADEL